MRLGIALLFILSLRRRNPARQPCPAADGELDQHPYRRRRQLRIYEDSHADCRGRADCCASGQLCPGNRRPFETQRARARSRRALDPHRDANVSFRQSGEDHSAPQLGRFRRLGPEGRRGRRVQQGGSKGTDAAKIATTAGAGAALGAIVDAGVRGAGIGAGAGGAVGLRLCCSRAGGKWS